MSEVPPYEEGLRSVISSHPPPPEKEEKEDDVAGETTTTKARSIPVPNNNNNNNNNNAHSFAASAMRRDNSGQSIASSQGKRSRSDLLAAAEEEKELSSMMENNDDDDENNNNDGEILADANQRQHESSGKNNTNDAPFESTNNDAAKNNDAEESPSSSSDLPKREGEKERKSLRPTNNYGAEVASRIEATLRGVRTTSEDIGGVGGFANASNSNSLGESPTTRLDYLNQATFDLNKSKRVGSGNNNTNASSLNANDGKPPKHDVFGGGQAAGMFAENSAVARVALDAHAARAPSPAEGMDSKLLRVRSMVTLDGSAPDLSAMGGGSSAEGSLEATDDEDALMTDEEEVDIDANNRNNQRQGVKEIDSPTTKSKQTSENDGGANLDRSGHSDGSVRSAEEGVSNETNNLAREQPKAALKPPARVLFGVYEAQGQRPYMEDRYAIISDWKFECAGKMSQNNYYNNNNNGQQQQQMIGDKQYIGVYDGHNGDWAASYAKEKMHTHLEKCAFIANGISPDASQQELEQFELGVKNSLIRSFIDLDEEILDGTKALNRRDGSTASVVLRVANHLFVAHAGDTRIVMGKRAMGLHDVRAKALTEDHKPSLPRERKRVYDEGGRVEFCGCWRVIAENRGRNVRAALAVSRAIGDIDFKRPENKGVTATPDVARITLDNEVENVIVATDGLWDVIGDQDAVRLCQSVLRGRFSEDACREAAEALTQEALERGSSDNVTVVVACFQH
jgi:serine/threonine protein phosphatase PrpC